MIFEDEFTNKISEIIFLFKEAVSDQVQAIYYFLYADQYGSFETVRFKVNDKLTNNIEAGISNDKFGEISDIVNDEIIPELEEIFKKANKEMPVEYKLEYIFETSALNESYKYKDDIDEEYNPSDALEEWISTNKKGE